MPNGQKPRHDIYGSLKSFYGFVGCSVSSSNADLAIFDPPELSS